MARFGVTYIVLVPNMKLDLERFALGHIDLEDEELMDYVEALGDTDTFRALATILVEVGLDLRRVRW